MGIENVYWTFSAAAQSISAFIAFILTGYALVYTLMEKARERDDSLEELHDSLLAIYHKRLKNLAILTGIAIICSLLLVFCISRIQSFLGWIVFLIGFLDFLAIISGLAFVISIVNPKKYKNLAEKTFNEIPSMQEPGEEIVPATDFVLSFLDLERSVREYLKKHKLYISSQNEPQMSYSFRRMIVALFQNEIIDSKFYAELLDINKYRNLVFHGHVNNVNKGLVFRAQTATSRIKSLSNRTDGVNP